MMKPNNTAEMLERVNNYSKRTTVALTTIVALTAPTLVSSRTTITSSVSYELTVDITNSNAEACIDICASDMVFDGQSHTVDVVDVQTLFAGLDRAVMQDNEAKFNFNGDTDQQGDPKDDVVDVQALFVKRRGSKCR